MGDGAAGWRFCMRSTQRGHWMISTVGTTILREEYTASYAKCNLLCPPAFMCYSDQTIETRSMSPQGTISNSTKNYLQRHFG